MFEVKIDTAELERMTVQMGSAVEQMPFAISRALNDAMFETKQVLTDVTWPRAVTVRNARFLDWALHIEKSDKHNLRASIYDSTGDNRAHLQMHADGGTKLPKGAHLAIPTANVSRGSSGVRINQKPISLVRSVRKGNLLFQEQGRGKKNRKLVLMYRLVSSARQPADVPFRQDFADAIKESAERHFPQRMMEAMRSAR